MTAGIAIVTGAGGGLGRAISRRLAVDGWEIAAIDRDGESLDTTVAAVATSGGVANGHRLDLRDPEAIAAVVGVIQAAGHVTALVNNAAVFPAGPIGEVTVDAYDDTIAINQRAYFLMAQAVLPQMQQRGSGAIVNVASITQHGGWGDMAAYVSTKGAAAAFTRALATEVGPDGVRVNCVAPGAFPTRAEEMHADREAYSQRIIESQALKRRGTADELAAAVAFLVSDEASFVTGQTINVDGGWKMA